MPLTDFSFTRRSTAFCTLYRSKADADAAIAAARATKARTYADYKASRRFRLWVAVHPATGETLYSPLYPSVI